MEKEIKLKKDGTPDRRAHNLGNEDALRRKQYRGGRKPDKGETRRMRTMKFTDDEYELIKKIAYYIKHDEEKAMLIKALLK